MKDSQVISTAALCPACGHAMSAERFERVPNGAVELDICYACRVIWFDYMESAQLAPVSVIVLFKKIHEHRADAYHTLPARLPCPRCRLPLTLIHDIVKSGLVTYHRCGRDHGRLTTFFHFLREKKFVRNLTPMELHSIKATVAEVRCSGCGAAVDITRDTACSHCGAPLSVLDSQAVEKALEELSERQARGSDPVRVAAAMYEALMVEPARMRAHELKATEIPGTPSITSATDLVLSDISALVSRFLK